MISSIEDLPDELFLEIFSYLSPRDLFLAFAYLNTHIDSTLCDQSVRLAVQLTEYHYTKIDYFADYFTHLFVFNDQMDIRQFNYIHSLTLGPSPRPTDELLNQLIDQPAKYFPYLTQLTVYSPLSTWYSPPAVRLWTQLFTNKLPDRLERCSLPGRIFAIPTTRFCCYSLRGLSIGGCSMRDFPALLATVPNLKFLSIDIWGVATAINSFADQHFNLSHLCIEFKQQKIVLDEIHFLLWYVPLLKTLTVQGIRKHDTFNVECWCEVLTNQLAYLTKFSCTIRLSDTHQNKNLNIDSIRQHHSLFSQMRLYRQNDSVYISNQ